MTLKTICQDALKEIGGFNVPDTIVGNTDPTARQLLALANRSGKTLAKDHKWQSLLETHTFSTADGTAAYALPSDYQKFAGITQWDRTTNWRLIGPVSATRWEYLKSSELVSAGLRSWFRVSGDQFEIYPTPTSVATIAFQYHRKTWAVASDNTEKEAFSVDTDTADIDEDLIQLDVIWRFKRAKGLPYQDDRADFNAARNTREISDGGAPVLYMNDRYQSDGIPETGFGL